MITVASPKQRKERNGYITIYNINLILLCFVEASHSGCRAILDRREILVSRSAVLITTRLQNPVSSF